MLTRTAAASDARSAIASINRSATNLEEPISDFASTGLPQLQQTIQQLEEATRSLQSLINDVRESPREFIQRPPSVEMEVEP